MGNSESLAVSVYDLIMFSSMFFPETFLCSFFPSFYSMCLKSMPNGSSCLFAMFFFEGFQHSRIFSVAAALQ